MAWPGSRSRNWGIDLEAKGGKGKAYIRSLLFNLVLQDLPQDIDAGVWFNGYACLHAQFVDIPDQLLRRRRPGGC